MFQILGGTFKESALQAWDGSDWMLEGAKSPRSLKANFAKLSDFSFSILEIDEYLNFEIFSSF